MSLSQRKSQFTDRRQGGPADGLRAGLVRATAEKKSLPLLGITVDQSLQVRVDGLDTDHLDSIVTKLQNGGEIDRAIVVFRTAEGKYLLADGFHRLEAYKQVGRKNVVCEVHDGEWEAARLFAETANMEHGLRINNEDKKGILESRLMRKYYENEDGVLASNAVIAADLGVTDRTIAGWLQELSTGKNFPVDLSRRLGKDGKVRGVETVQESNRERAAELAERRAAEEAERKRGLPATDKIRVITQYLISKYRDAQAKKGKPLFDDPDKGFKWCFQVSNPVFVVDIDWEHQFLREYGAKPAGMYREFLRMADQATFTEADMDGWTDEALADWVTAMKQRPPRQPSSGTETFGQTGMAQPKHPAIEPPQLKTLGRHRLTEQSAATEVETRTQPTYDCPLMVGQRILVLATGEVTRVGAVEWVDVEWRLRSTSFPEKPLLLTDVEAVPECPFAVGQNVEVFESGEKGVVQRVQYVNHEWQIHVSLYDGVHVFKADEIDRIFAEQLAEALEKPYDPQPGDDGTCPYVIGQDVSVVATGEVYTVASLSFHGNEWRVYVEGESDYATLDQLAPYIAPPTVEEAFSRPNGNGQPSHEPADEIAALRMAMNNLKAAATELQRTEVTTLRLLAPKIKEVYIRDLREVDDYVHSVVMAVTQLIGRAVNA